MSEQQPEQEKEPPKVEKTELAKEPPLIEKTELAKEQPLLIEKTASSEEPLLIEQQSKQSGELLLVDKHPVDKHPQEWIPGEQLELVRIPPPTIWPATVALGITGIAFGVVTHWILSMAGLFLFLLGAAGWIEDLKKDVL
jgi:hypothetical protein